MNSTFQTTHVGIDLTASPIRLIASDRTGRHIALPTDTDVATAMGSKQSGIAQLKVLLAKMIDKLDLHQGDYAEIVVVCSPLIQGEREAIEDCFLTAGVKHHLRQLDASIAAACSSRSVLQSSGENTLVIELSPEASRYVLCSHPRFSPIESISKKQLNTGIQQLKKAVIQLLGLTHEDATDTDTIRIPIWEILEQTNKWIILSRYPEWKIEYPQKSDLENILREFAHNLADEIAVTLGVASLQSIILAGQASELGHGFLQAFANRLQQHGYKSVHQLLAENNTYSPFNRSWSIVAGAWQIAKNPDPVLPRMGVDVCMPVQVGESLRRIPIVLSTFPIRKGTRFSLMSAITKAFPEFQNAELRLHDDDIRNKSLHIHCIPGNTPVFETAVGLHGVWPEQPDSKSCFWPNRPMHLDVALTILDKTIIQVDLVNMETGSTLATGELKLPEHQNNHVAQQ